MMNSDKSGSENILRPSADLAREKTEASIEASRQSGTHDAGDMKNGENCEAVSKMVSLENDIHNTSPNATNIQD